MKLAHIIVTGRKNKRLNAHTNLDDGSPSNKKAREDFPEIENSPSDEQGQQDEVEQAIKEIRTKLDDEKNVTVVKFG